jgi:hypothetical protein
MNHYFRERARHADRSETMRILEKAGTGNAALPGDELPPSAERIRAQKRASSKPLKQK